MERLSKHLANPHSDVGGAKRAKVTVKKENKEPVQTDRVEMGVEEGFVPMTPEKQKKVDRQIRRSADAEAIESGKRDRDRDDKKVDKEYRRQQAMRFQQKMKKEDLDIFSEAELAELEEKMSAFDLVKQGIEKQYGKGAIIDTKAPKKEMSPEEKKKNADRRAKNWSDNNKKYDPYKSRAGESD